MRGKHHSAETRAKISAKAQGRVVTAESRAKALETKLRRGTIRSGAQTWNWKGGRPWERFKDPRYLAWRAAVLERDGYRCRDCGRCCKKYEKGLAAHHIKSYTDYPALRYDVSNGLCLCRRCHMALHGKTFVQEMIACACGCGTVIPSHDVYGRRRRFVRYHGRGWHQTPSQKEAIAQRRGKPLSDEHRTKISAGVRRAKKKPAAVP